MDPGVAGKLVIVTGTCGFDAAAFSFVDGLWQASSRPATHILPLAGSTAGIGLAIARAYYNAGAR